MQTVHRKFFVAELLTLILVSCMKATLSTIHNFKLQLHQIKNVSVSSLGQQSGEMFKELLLILPAHVMVSLFILMMHANPEYGSESFCVFP